MRTRVHWAWVLAAALVVACGSSDNTKKARDDAGADAPSGGGSSGADASSPGSGGAAGAAAAGGAGGGGAVGGGGSGGAIADAGPDVSVEGGADASPGDGGADVVEAGLVCTGDASAVPFDGGDAGDAAAGLWADYAAGVCRPCTGRALDCDDFLGPPDPVFDPVTQILTLHVAPSVAEIVSGTFTYRYATLSADGSFQSIVTAAPFQVSENTLVADLSEVPDTADLIDHGLFDVTDACGTRSDTSGSFDELQIELTPLDAGGTSVRTSCELLD